MKALSKIAAAALLGAGALTLAATSASARIVCNTDGDCWHTTTVYDYPPAAGVVIHEDKLGLGPERQIPLARARRPRLLARRRLGRLLIRTRSRAERARLPFFSESGTAARHTCTTPSSCSTRPR